MVADCVRVSVLRQGKAAFRRWLHVLLIALGDSRSRMNSLPPWSLSHL